MTTEQKLREALQRIKDDTILDRQDANYYKRIMLVHISWCEEALSAEPQTSDEGTPGETPLTDAEAIRFARLLIDWSSPSERQVTELVPSEFARQLERTLHEQETPRPGGKICGVF